MATCRRSGASGSSWRPTAADALCPRAAAWPEAGGRRIAGWLPGRGRCCTAMGRFLASAIAWGESTCIAGLAGSNLLRCGYRFGAEGARRILLSLWRCPDALLHLLGQCSPLKARKARLRTSLVLLRNCEAVSWGFSQRVPFACKFAGRLVYSHLANSSFTYEDAHS